MDEKKVGFKSYAFGDMPIQVLTDNTLVAMDDNTFLTFKELRQLNQRISELEKENAELGSALAGAVKECCLVKERERKAIEWAHKEIRTEIDWDMGDYPEVERILKLYESECKKGEEKENE